MPYTPQQNYVEKIISKRGLAACAFNGRQLRLFLRGLGVAGAGFK
jgi:hypothetical protein